MMIGISRTAGFVLASVLILGPAWADNHESTDEPEIETEEMAAEAQEKAEIKPDPKVRAKALELWEDYIHYLRVANLEAADANGKALLELEVADSDLLEVVDELSPYRDYQKTLLTGQKLEARPESAEMAKQMEIRIQEARLNLAREGSRIRTNIDILDDGLRARLNAVQRLRKAGEYSAPHMLAVLLSIDGQDRLLRPYVIEAMVAIGRPLVVPLCEALRDLPPVPAQQVAQVLARIGYRVALPYLKAELVKPGLDNNTRLVMQTAFNRIVEDSDVPPNTDPATLFLMLGEDYYNNREGLVLEPQQKTNLLWSYGQVAGLTAMEIPTPVFHDVMAMRAAARSLELNENLSASLSLWVAANLRRENNLGKGSDPSYRLDKSPYYFATMAGPSHVQPVLSRALSGADAELALDAIRALNSTATTAEKIGDDIQPLIIAMGYSDRRVRFESAFAIARSLPRLDFSGAQRVVPVLAEAIREKAKPYALILGSDDDAINSTRAAVFGDQPDFQVIFGRGLDAASDQIASVPGVDVVVINMSPVQTEATISLARNQPKLMGAPILVLAAPNQVPNVTEVFSRTPKVRVTSAGALSAEFAEAVGLLINESAGSNLSEEQALNYALTSLSLLLDITREGGTTYTPQDAKPALIAALDDERAPVVTSSGAVLARFSDAESQHALADAALDETREDPIRIDLFGSLAESGRVHGNHLTDGQIQLLLKVVKESKGPLADAAAEAHGALDLPTSNAVELIVAE